MGPRFCLGLTCLFFIFLKLNSVSGLLCYVCSTKNENERDCDDITLDSDKYLQNCTAPKNVTCRVQVQWIDFEAKFEGKDKHVIRKCASTEYDPQAPCYERTGYLGRMNVCACTTDACNESSKSVSTNIFKVFVVSLLTFLLI
ncbi:protein quiver [Caerostris darwini]|uniref:Protein quiver n=1 Tax=Caerostris darwini TaxID=1538125 RepID=A0AAV4W540_9ARAC|nr:protein quiver [Caerostris darwini]